MNAFDGLTQARRLAEADQMAREWIALATGASIDDITVNVTVEPVGGVDVSGRPDEIPRQRAQAVRDLAREVAACDDELLGRLAE